MTGSPEYSGQPTELPDQISSYYCQTTFVFSDCKCITVFLITQPSFEKLIKKFAAKEVTSRLLLILP